MEIFTTCLACDYTRKATDHAPEWQCPKCQKAYVKTACLLQKHEGAVHSTTLGNSMKQTSNLNAKRKKNKLPVAALLIIAVLGASLFFFYQLGGKSAGVSSASVAPSQVADVSFEMLSSAHGYYGFAPQSKDQWKIASEKWVQQSVVAVQHVAGGGGLGLNAAAQSFIPHCDIIRAIQICLYPVGPPGWIRIQITDDAGGTPGQILDTAWLRVDRGCPVPHSGYMMVPFDDVAVNPNDTYWFTVVEFRDTRSSESHLTNLGFSDTDTYHEGKILLPPKYALQGLFDTNFRIIREFKTLPGIRAAADAEKQSLPSQAEQEAVRHIWTQEMPQPPETHIEKTGGAGDGS